MQGWISLHRKILDNPIVCKDSDYFSVWCYLLLNATHDNYDAEFKGSRITLQPGQLITGRQSIAKQFALTESKVQRILKKLENEQQIEQQTSNRNRLITVLNWSQYQQGEQPIEQQVNNKRTTDEQQVNTNNNVNNENKKNSSALINEFFEKHWKLYPSKRGKGQVKDTQKKKLYALGDEFERCITRYIDYQKQNNGWLKLQNGSTFFNSGYVDYLDENTEQEQQEEPDMSWRNVTWVDK